jgi:hypothetical protein
VSAHRPVGLIARDGSEIDRAQYRQPRFRSLRFSYCRGVSSSRAERRGYADQLFVEQHDRNPLGPAAARPLRVYRLNRGFELKPAGATATRCFGEMAFRLFDQWLAEMVGIDLTEEQTLALIDDLIAKRLIGWDGETLIFLTHRCSTIFTPKDGIVVHDMVDDRLDEWMERPERWTKSAPVVA